MNVKILIAGPCVGEHSKAWIVDQAALIDNQLLSLDNTCAYDWVFKCSFDKANRTGGGSYRGLGLETTLDALQSVKEIFGCRVTTDIHEVWQANEVASVVDIIQIPAMLSRQTDLIRAASRNTAIVNIKCMTSASVEEMGAATEKVSALNGMPWLTYRGTAFGDELVFDPSRLWRLGVHALAIADVTHSARNRSLKRSDVGEPFGARGSTLVNARVAAALDVAGLFIECHPEPSKALSDAETQIKTSHLAELLEGLQWSK